MVNTEITIVKGGKKFDKWKREIKQWKPGEIEVGFISTAKYPPVYTGIKWKEPGTEQKPLPVAQVAVWNEFGTKRIPERPFFRNALATGEPKIVKLMRDLLDRPNLTLSTSAKNAVGMVMADEIKESITNLKTPPNKGARSPPPHNPLIDTGFMRMSVTWRVPK